MGVKWAHLVLAVQEPMAGSCEHRHASQGSIKREKFLVQLRIRQLSTKAVLLLSNGSALISERVLCLGSISSKSDLLLGAVFLEKLTGFQPVKKIPKCYGTRRFITAFTSVHHLSLS